jgi:hypothetical protein
MQKHDDNHPSGGSSRYRARSARECDLENVPAQELKFFVAFRTRTWRRENRHVCVFSQGEEANAMSQTGQLVWACS